MRLISLVAAFVLFISGPAFAQEWIEYQNREDLFSVNFPADPEVSTISWATEYGITLPGRLYVAKDGPNRYSVTVVDYNDAQQLHAKRLEGCKLYPNVCQNPFNGELRGAIDFALWGILQRDAKLTHYAYYNSDRVEGRRIQLLNADKTKTFAAIHMHQNRLYIFEGTVTASSPPPGLFQQSLGWIDKQGRRIRYATTYSNVWPAPGMQRGLPGYGPDEGQPPTGR